MITSLEKLTRNTSSDIFDSLAFKNIIEDHLSWLIDHATTQTITVTAHQINVYEFDWIGLLTTLDVHPDLMHTTIRMNGGMSLTDVPLMLRALKVPDYTLLQNFIVLISSTAKIK